MICSPIVGPTMDRARKDLDACQKLAKWFEFAPPAYRKDLVESPLPLLCVMFGLVGCLSVLMGLLAEMLTRTYHESQAKPVYAVGEVAEASTGSGATPPREPSSADADPPSVPTAQEI